MSGAADTAHDRAALSVAVRHRRGSFDLDVAFDAPAGVTVLFGPSGSGKSTVLEAVCGLLRHAEGRVAVGGQVLFDTARGIDLPAQRRRCGVVFQDSRLFAHLDVGANLRFGARRAPRRERGDAPPAGHGFDAVVELLGLRDLLARRPRSLSGGERQRVAIGRALLSRPRLLLMDEPLAALDAPRRAEILPYLERLRDAGGPPMLYVTHAVEELDRLADTVVLIEAGRVVARGAAVSVLSRADVAAHVGEQAGVLIEGRVGQRLADHGLSEVLFAGGTLLMRARPEVPGRRVRVRIRARDVAIATTAPVGLSTSNVLPARLVAISPQTGPGAARASSDRDAGTLLVTLAVGETTLLASITTLAAARLALRPGMAVHAVIKAVAPGWG